jgi:hypothetical protein
MLTNVMLDYDTLKANVENKGAVTAQLASGVKFELRKNNTDFSDTNKKLIIVKVGTDEYWIDVASIVFYHITQETVK